MTLLSLFKSGDSTNPEVKETDIVIKATMGDTNDKSHMKNIKNDNFSAVHDFSEADDEDNIDCIEDDQAAFNNLIEHHASEDRSTKNPLSKLSIALQESALLSHGANGDYIDAESFGSSHYPEDCWPQEEVSDDNVSVLLPNFAAAAGIDDEYKESTHTINNADPINIVVKDNNPNGDIDETKNIYFRKNSVDLDYEFSSSDDDYVYENEKVKDMMKHEESPEEYVKGGYHPAKKNEYFYRRKYRLIQKLGWGHFSTVWLAKDLTAAYNDKNKYVALKIVKASPSSSEAARDETDLLIELYKADDNALHSGKDYVIKLLSAFYHNGPNGIHTCMAFELLGENLLKLSERNEKRRLPIIYVKQIAKQLLLALDFLHRKCGIIHTDIKPENVLMEIGDLETITEMIKIQKIQKRKLKYEPRRNRSNTKTKTRSNSKIDSNSVTDGISTFSNSNNDFDKKTDKDFFSASELKGEKPADVLFDQEEENEEFEKQNNHKEGDLADEENEEEVKKEESDCPDSRSIFKTMKSSLSYLMYPPAATPSRKKSMVCYSMPLPSVLSAKQFYSKSHEDFPDEAEMMSKSVKDILNPIPNMESNIIKIKIGDMGNGCWIDYHFSSEIQTREYRCPEAIVGYKWGCAVDLWSVACLLFELLTGDVLFSPQAGKSYSKEDDHMAQIEELLGEVPKKLKTKGKYSRALYRRNGNLRNIGGLRPWNLFEVFTQKYGVEENLAQEMTDFLLPMLEIDPCLRADAGGMVNHPWLKDALGMEDVVVEDRPIAGGSGMDLPGWDDVEQVIRPHDHCLYRKDEDMNFKNI